jgi:hypothetical protein
MKYSRLSKPNTNSGKDGSGESIVNRNRFPDYDVIAPYLVQQNVKF